MAADSINTIKLFSPLIAGDDVVVGASASDDVLHDAHHGSELLFEFGHIMTKRALRHGREVRAA